MVWEGVDTAWSGGSLGASSDRNRTFQSAGPDRSIAQSSRTFQSLSNRNTTFQSARPLCGLCPDWKVAEGTGGDGWGWDDLTGDGRVSEVMGGEGAGWGGTGGDGR